LADDAHNTHTNSSEASDAETKRSGHEVRPYLRFWWC
jgi:hypothetical protein